MSPSPRALAVAMVVALVVGAPVVAAGSPPAAAQPGPEDSLAQQVDADSVRMLVALQPDGDAQWTVTYRVQLDTENETQAFESLRSDIEENPENYTDRFASRMRATAAAAENETGREMSVRNVSVDARIQDLGRTYGIVEYTFEWTGFAVVDGETIRAGDALAGLFLDEGTTLVFSWPDDYGATTVRPSPDSSVSGEHSAGWAGPQEFGTDEPRVVVEPGAGPADDGGIPLSGLLAGVLLLALGVAAGAMWYRRRGTAVPSAPGSEQAGEDASGSGGDAGAAGSAGAAAGGEEPPEELLSNEEKVMKLVRDRGGRIKQQEIVDEFDWTEAKTSQVVRDLRDDGDLEGFRLGRENVLRLPEEGDEDGP